MGSLRSRSDLHEIVSAPPARNAEARHAQAAWAATPLRDRLALLKRARGILARMAGDLAEAIPRPSADTLAAEVLPLLAACKFLETSAPAILRTRRLGRSGLPFWLSGVASEVQRVPFGTVLILGPANYPLFLPGVQVLQALAAGNAAIWKPGFGGKPVAEVFAAALDRAGLPQHLLRITEDTVAAAEVELQAQPDKIFFTGSAQAARQVLAKAAETLTPCIIEAAGCDAVIALPSSDANRLAEALTFGMRLNGSATCMAPRRLLLVGTGHEPLLESLRKRFAAFEGIVISDQTRRQLRTLTREATAAGADFAGDLDTIFLKPILILNGDPTMQIAQADLFAPVLTVIACQDEQAVLEAQQACPFGLTAAIFGDPAAARKLGEKLTVGTLLINDLIVPTADPRVPFGGRRGSGFGVTRGTEGLLEMTAIRTILTRTGKSTQHYQPTTDTHAEMFQGVLHMSHAPTPAERWSGLRRMIGAARKLGQRQPK